jgi:hypothetical protein
MNYLDLAKSVLPTTISTPSGQGRTYDINDINDQSPPVPWERAVAATLVNNVVARRREVFGETDWPADPAECRRLEPLVAAVDDAEWFQDLAGLRQVVAALLAAYRGIDDGWAARTGYRPPARTGFRAPERGHEEPPEPAKKPDNEPTLFDNLCPPVKEE